jgi:hypothetical protein
MPYSLRDGHYVGRMYLSTATRPLARQAANGRFGLSLLAYTEPAPGVLTQWWLLWAGQAALDFCTQHGHTLTPGRTLDVDLIHLTALDGAGRGSGAEIHAHVVDLRCPGATAAVARA